MNRKNRASLGYGIGYIGQGASYGFISVYFVIYLTNCVGISAFYASLIMSLSLIVEVAAGMLWGNLSDRCRLKMGRRRPFILLAAVTMPVIMYLLFCKKEGGFTGVLLYYLLLSVLFRVFFSCFEIPNGAFGAEITTDYDGRTRLRTISRVGAIVGNFAAYVMPLWILDFFAEEQAKGWHTIGTLIGVICFVSWFSSFLLVTEKPQHSTETKIRNVLSSIWKNYTRLLKLKPTRILVFYKAAFATAFALYNVSSMYYMKYSLRLSNQYTSYIYFFSIVVFVLATPLVDFTAIRMGKARQQMYTMLFAGIIAALLFAFCRGSFAGGVIYVLVFSLVQTSFWQLSLSIFYDLVEVEEFVYGSRSEGDIMSMVSVLGTIVTAAIVQIFGFFFEAAGFNPAAAEQSGSTVLFLNASFMLIPGICFILGAIALRAFPINKETFASLTAAVKLKQEGKEYEKYIDDIHRIMG